MNPLNTIKGTIIAGFVLALVLGLAVKASLKTGTSAEDAAKAKVEKNKR